MACGARATTAASVRSADGASARRYKPLDEQMDEVVVSEPALRTFGQTGLQGLTTENFHS